MISDEEDWAEAQDRVLKPDEGDGGDCARAAGALARLAHRIAPTAASRVTLQPFRQAPALRGLAIHLPQERISRWAPQCSAIGLRYFVGCTDEET